MEPFPLRDCLSVTGVNGYGRSMAVGNQGQLVFKKSATELIYYDVHEISVNTLKLSKKDPLFDDCFFYDFSFLRGGTLAVCLQRPTTGELFICEGTIDPQERIVDVSGAVHPTKIFTGKGRNVNLIMDEAGVVLISYPIKWTGKDFIELFHVSNYFSAGAGDKYLISLTSKDRVDATFGNIFISRNHLYMFYGHDYSKFLLVSLAGTSCGKCEIRASHGLPPSEAYISKTSLVFEDFALVYAYMNIRSTVKPNLYMLNLTNLKWIPLNLSLSHHFPNGKVTLQKLGEELIYMHGDCNVIGCTEKAHLYQINVEPIMGLISSRSRSQSAGFAFGCLQYPSVSNLTKIADRRSSSVSTVLGRQSHSLETPPTTPVDSVPVIYKSDAPIVQRYKKKQSKDEQTRRRYSTNAAGKVSSSSVDSNECIKRSPSCSSLHWCADMAEQSSRSLQDQIKLAHEMGYREEDVIAALNMHMQGQSDQPYHAFESTNSMLDLLNQASARQEPKLKLSVYQATPAPEKERPPRAHSVSRSSSFHIGSPRPNRTENDDLFRLIRTLEKEKERDKREVEQQFIRLKTRIHELEHECELQKRDIEQLRAENTDHSSELRERNIRLDKLMDEINAIRDNYDKETIKNSRLSKDLHDQKELIDHRRKKYEEEQCSWDKKNISLQEELEKLSLELQRKCALLDEQTSISRNLEQRNTSLQTGALLERIDEKMEARLRMDKEIVEENGMMRELFINIRTKMPELEAAKQRAEAAIEDCERKRQEETDSLRREINGLLEKTTSECCICLSTKPNVVFMPCKHLAICHGCEKESPQLSECPACRAKIESTLQIYT